MRRVGLEIEVENQSFSYHDARRSLQEYGDSCLWAIEMDGSLRNGGYEIKHRAPTEFGYVKASLAQLYPIISGSSGSWRAAVHVHVDVRDLIRRGGLNYALAACVLYDSALFERHSPERVESNFCVPLLNRRVEVASSISSGGSVPYGKYSSVNVGRLHDLGTFEFRHMRTPEATRDIQSVTECINNINRFAEDCVSVVSAGCDCYYFCGDDTGKAVEWLLNNPVRELTIDSEGVGMIWDALVPRRAASPTMLDMASITRACVPSGRVDPDHLDLEDFFNELEEED